MIEPAGGAELLLKALEHHGVVGHVRRDDLDGDDLAGFAVTALVDRPHAAFGNPLDEVIIADALHNRLRGFHHRGNLRLPKATHRTSRANSRPILYCG